jgi:hypothetical protein
MPRDNRVAEPQELPISLRFDQLNALRYFSRVDAAPVADLVRTAVENYIRGRKRTDPQAKSDLEERHA